MLDLDRGASFSGNYEVLTDDADLDKIVVTVEGPAPRHKVHYESKGLEEGSFTIEAQHSGDHDLCFKNKLEGGESVTVVRAHPPTHPRVDVHSDTDTHTPEPGYTLLS